jgi:hypothetical protein
MLQVNEVAVAEFGEPVRDVFGENVGMDVQLFQEAAFDGKYTLL